MQHVAGVGGKEGLHAKSVAVLLALSVQVVSLLAPARKDVIFVRVVEK